MNATPMLQTECGSAHCACQSQAATSLPEAALVPVASVNGVPLHPLGQRPDDDELRELAYTELLRQHAVSAGLLPVTVTSADLTEAQRHTIETMVDQAVTSPLPTDEECRRYYEANTNHFVVGQAQHVRHILFAVTPGVNVHALAVRAENALLTLSRKDVPEGQFARLASELSNCPSSVQGGDLGWIGPNDCAPELANELFHQKHPQWGLGVHPRLVHTRFGFHIIEVLGSKKGKQIPYEQVQQRIAATLSMQSRAVALNQYMRLLAGQATVKGVDLESASTPLVQ